MGTWVVVPVYPEECGSRRVLGAVGERAFGALLQRELDRQKPSANLGNDQPAYICV
jgi:hypothetical protein